MKQIQQVLMAMFVVIGFFCHAEAGVPSVATTIPAAGATGVSVTSPVTIQFNEAVLWGSVYNTGVYRITIDEAGTGILFKSLVYTPEANDTTYVMTPSSAFKANTTYRVIVETLIRSESTEELMALPYEFTFTTDATDNGLPPEVSSTYPAAGAIDIPLDTKVIVRFSEPMLPSTITSLTVRIKNLSANAYITVSVTYDEATNSASVVPAVPLAKNSSYQIEVSGVQDLLGNSLDGMFTAAFSTILADTAAPFVKATSPTKGATGVATGTVSITFSEPVDQTTLTSATFSVKQGTTTITGSIGYDEASATASFVPTAGFDYAKDYTVAISTGIKDLAGNNLTPAYSFTFTTVQASAPAAMSAYSHVPPFVAGAGVPPNVLMVVDNSGSMDEKAYTDSYSSGNPYYGYFDNNKMYVYNTTSKRFEATVTAKNVSATTLSTTTAASGNFLNWLATRRIDAVRMSLVGGVKDNGNDREYYPGPQFKKTYGGKEYYVKTASNKAVIIRCDNSSCNSNTTYQATVGITDQERTDKPGLIRQFEGQMRLGMMFYNGGYDFEDKGTRDGGVVQIDIGQTGADFVTQVLSTPADTWTPLAETLYEATRYFGATTSAYNGGTYSGKKPILNDCQRNFVLVLTDGESSKDRNVPGGNWTGYKESIVPVTDSDFDVKDYLMGNSSSDIKGIRELEPTTSLLPTNPWNTSMNTMEGTWYLPGVAYYAHKKDLRSDMGGLQNLTIYTVFAFDDSNSARELLKLTAKYGAFDDTDGSGAPDVTAKWDKNGDGNPDTYFEASDGDALEKQLKKAFDDILSRVSSGTAASILNNSEGSGANLLQAVFYPKKSFDDGTEVNWIGEIQNLWYHIDPYLASSTVRVDTVVDNTLDIKQDKIARFEFDQTSQQTVVRLAGDSDGNGIADGDWVTYSPDDTVNVKSLWRAGRLLWERNLSTNPRTIYTHTNGLTDTAAKAFDSSTTGLSKFSYALEPGYSSKLTSVPFFQQLMQAANVTEADKLAKYIHGVPELDIDGKLIDMVGYRSRLATLGTQRGLWRLGDIVSSTPKLLSNNALNTYAQPTPTGYGDGSYDQFVKSSVYQNRGMVFVGGNDGMLHAFKLGKLAMISDGTSKKAQLLGTDLGNEEWAFIPRNVLPYLRYFADPEYSHLFYVDGSTLLLDVSIHRPSDNDSYKFADNTLQYKNCTDDQYWKCIKQTKYSNTTTKELDWDKTSWRSVLIGSTGLGGAGRNKSTSGYCYEKTGSDCVKTPVDGGGFSTYYALDVTDPTNPKFMWEFNGDPAEGADADKKGGNLGYATSGPVIVRVGDKDKNGRWFAVFASGPTGPIDKDSRQFLGRSDQPLKLFVVDIGTGKLVTTINTGIESAFSGSLSNGAIDTDRSNKYSPGFYSDDALYVGYTKKTDATTWYNGGVGRVLTKESVYPDKDSVVDGADVDNPKDATKNWAFSKVFEGSDVGPVTAAVTKLQDRGNGKLWLYFGSGRYFFKTSTGIDDPTSQRRIYGVSEPCYTKGTNDINQGCTEAATVTTDLQDQTTITAVDINKEGWYIDLDPAETTVSSERVITDPVASPSGTVFFTTFQPNSDVCSYGGSSNIWAIDYKSGGLPSTRAMQGKLLMQVSTGAFAELSMSSAFAAKEGRRTTDAVQGVPPKAQGLSILTNPKPVKRIMHIQEK
ncbi:MAG: Ig-like domain-containing protein [Desulfuromonadaceae bacterium]